MKRGILISLLVIASLLPAFILGCESAKSAEGDNDMVTKSSIPSIDINVPTHIETATFALG